MKKNRIVAYLRIILCAYASTSIMGITPPSISFYESIKTPQWIKNPTQQAYVQTLLNRMPQRLSVFARKNPYTTALIAAILSSGGIYGGYAGLKWVWKSPRKAPTPPQPEKPALVVEPQPVPEPAPEPASLEERKAQFKKKWDQEKYNITRQISELKEQLDRKRPHATAEQKTTIETLFKLLITSGMELHTAIKSLLSPQDMSNLYTLYFNSVVPKQKKFLRVKESLSNLLNGIPDAAPAK